MQHYAQKNYPQELGNGRYTIAQAGCFLTSICNLLATHFDLAIDPPALNNFYRAHGHYMKDPDGAHEDLSWSSPTVFAPSVVVGGIGHTGEPTSGQAIVVFHYTSPRTGQPIEHYCAVDRIENGQVCIIDSYDGLVKAPSQYQAAYGHIRMWAVYVLKHKPTPPPPVHTAPHGAAPFPSTNETYKVLVALHGYVTAQTAASRLHSNSTVPPGVYRIFNKASGMINITTQPGRPGWWINPGDNVIAGTAPPKAAQYEVHYAVPGYMTATEAATHKDAVVTVSPAQYYVFNTAEGMFNVTRIKDKPGAWINPRDNVPNGQAPRKAQESVPEPKPDPAATGTSWRVSYKPHRQRYVALNSTVVHDLGGQRPDVMLRQYDIVPVAGTFTGPDGKLYARTQNSANNFWWYGIPMDNLVSEDEVYHATTTTATRQVTNMLTLRDRLVIVAAHCYASIEKLQRLFRNKK